MSQGFAVPIAVALIFAATLTSVSYPRDGKRWKAVVQWTAAAALFTAAMIVVGTST